MKSNNEEKILVHVKCVLKKHFLLSQIPRFKTIINKTITGEVPALFASFR